MSPFFVFLGIGLVISGFWAAYSRGRPAASLVVPIGYVLFIVGLIRWLIPGFFPF